MWQGDHGDEFILKLDLILLWDKYCGGRLNTQYDFDVVNPALRKMLDQSVSKYFWEDAPIVAMALLHAMTNAVSRY